MHKFETLQETYNRRKADHEQDVRSVLRHYGSDILENIDLDNSYVIRHLKEIANDFRIAQNENLVFEVSLGKELTLNLTPDDIIKRLEAYKSSADALNFDVA